MGLVSANCKLQLYMIFLLFFLFGFVVAFVFVLSEHRQIMIVVSLTEFIFLAVEFSQRKQPHYIPSTCFFRGKQWCSFCNPRQLNLRGCLF